MSEIEQRLSALEDRFAIQDLVVRYFVAVDSDDVETVTSVFAEDATFSLSGSVVASGRANVIEYLVDARKAMGLTVHTPNYVLPRDKDAHTKQGVVGAHLELVLNGVAVFGAVRYEDEYVRTEGKWLIRHRDMRTIHIAPWNEISAAFPSEGPVRWPGAAPLPSDYPRKR